ncbi:YbbR-like domain-containing protein [Marinirhabdus gelatinilytica]|uniref:YbbR-like protein n=1 Tax=Marinirhabdus gelatinilytica TaxID=1703343 RepID=A0A370QF18_9FLAO|nr:hypothetical protein [Marinirhabdus gelatinilytica]RDK86869.1 hypothetical protein C8D94_10247 [Marinirhabdus gelatinilytica]
MAASIKTFKSIKINTFFVFLLLAIVFWGLTKFSKDNTAKIKATFTYQNIPVNYLLEEGNPQEITFDITSNGFDILLYKLKSPSVEIDVAKYFDDTTGSAQINSEDLKDEITKQLNYKGASIRNLSNNSIAIKLEGIQTKKIPVRPQARILYKNGFNAVDSLRTRPDSVIVSGPSILLDSINGIATKEIILENVDKPIKNSVALVSLPNSSLTLHTETVTLHQDVQEFAQKKVSLPITLKNLPASATIKLIPERIQVTFVVPIENFGLVTESDFEVLCDFEERNSEENFLTPVLSKKPPYARNIQLSPQKIDFLIFK